MSNQGSNNKNQLSSDAIEDLKRRMIFGEAPSSTRHSTRFQKGQSGNPKGRPRKAPALPAAPTQIHELTLAEAERLIRVRDGDKVTEIPVKQALLQAQTATALKGSAYAQRDALNRHDRAQREEAAEIARSQEFWRSFREDAQRQFDEAKASGKSEPVLYPHPEDILIEPGKGVRIVGPANAEEARHYERLAKVRDALIMQSAVNTRCCPRGEERRGEACAEGADLLFFMIEKVLPKRMRLDEYDWRRQTTLANGINKLQLLRRTYATWRAAGVPVPRGALAPRPGLARELKGALETMARKNY